MYGNNSGNYHTVHYIPPHDIKNTLNTVPPPEYKKDRRPFDEEILYSTVRTSLYRITA